jgi:hypothetical protein
MKANVVVMVMMVAVVVVMPMVVDSGLGQSGGQSNEGQNGGGSDFWAGHLDSPGKPEKKTF